MERTEEDKAELYLESHVTIEPIFDKRREEASRLARTLNFKLANLLMKKDREATEQRSDRDTFMTGHSKSREDITVRTKALVMMLQANGYKVWRYKIEDTLVDSKIRDEWSLLRDEGDDYRGADAD